MLCKPDPSRQRLAGTSTVTAGITFDPSSAPQVTQTMTATFTVTNNRGGSTAVIGALTLLETTQATRYLRISQHQVRLSNRVGTPIGFPEALF